MRRSSAKPKFPHNLAKRRTKEERFEMVSWGRSDVSSTIVRRSLYAEDPKKERRKTYKKLFFRILLLSGLVAIGMVLWTMIPRTVSKGAMAVASPGVPASSLPVLKRSSRARVVHTVLSGETLSTITKKYGLSYQLAVDIQRELLKLKKEKKIKARIRAGQEIVFELNPQGTFLRVLFDLGPGRELVLQNSKNGLLSSFEELPRTYRDVHAKGGVKSSFAAAAADAKIPYDIVDEFVDLFGNKVAFHRDFRSGDTFTLFYREETLPDGTLVSAGPILGAALSMKSGGEIEAVRWVGTDGQARYFNGNGELMANTFLRYPLKFSRISSTFSRSRFHPVLKRRRPHNGVDFAAPRGTPIRSVADGRILFAGRKGGNGIMLKIRHTERYETAYLHLSRITKGLRKGTRVKRGQIIGAVGSTGMATGPHLHYSFYDRGKYVDPLKIKLPTVERLKKGMRIEKEYLRSMRAAFRHYQSSPNPGEQSGILSDG